MKLHTAYSLSRTQLPVSVAYIADTLRDAAGAEQSAPSDSFLLQNMYHSIWSFAADNLPLPCTWRFQMSRIHFCKGLISTIARQHVFGKLHRIANSHKLKGPLQPCLRCVQGDVMPSIHCRCSQTCPTSVLSKVSAHSMSNLGSLCIACYC